MAFEIVAIGILLLLVLAILEMIHRKVLENKRQIEMQRNKFKIIEERLRKQAKFIQQNFEKPDKKEKEPVLDGDIIKCPKCNKPYDAIIEKCPFCGF